MKYVYRCINTHEIEVKQSIQDEPLTECPECQAQTRRIIQPNGVHYKTSGFYVKDSKAGRNGAKEVRKHEN